jgi:hypothetical protein
MIKNWKFNYSQQDKIMNNEIVVYITLKQVHYIFISLWWDSVENSLVHFIQIYCIPYTFLPSGTRTVVCKLWQTLYATDPTFKNVQHTARFISLHLSIQDTCYIHLLIINCIYQVIWYCIASKLRWQHLIFIKYVLILTFLIRN